MTKYLFCCAFAAFFISSCGSDKSPNNTRASLTPEGVNAIAGNWIAIDFCSFAGKYGSVLKAMNNTHKPYAYAITFNPAKPDSALCFNGFESFYLPLKIQGDTLIELIGARPGKSIFLDYDAQTNKDMTMYDATMGRAYTNQMIKAGNSSKTGYQSFLTALNHQLLAGTFHLKGNKKAAPVQFTSNGEIIGLADYDRFELCTAGDCFLTAQEIDIVTCSKSRTKDSDNYFGFRFSDDLKTLTLYHLINANPEEKGTYAIGQPAYTLVRE